MKNFYYDDGTVMKEYLDRANALKESIINSPNTDFDIKGKKYYISNSGCDLSDGLSPEACIKTIEKLHSIELLPGDAIYFKRGDLCVGSEDTRHYDSS